jgi:hypothetical protein
MLTLDVPQQATSFSSNNPVTLTVRSVGNPEWGEMRTARSFADWDVNQSSVYHLYDVWTERFTIYLYNNDSTSLQYTAKSYGVLNSAYLGFDYQYRRLMVNNSYDPQDMSDRIMVHAGTQTTDRMIST